MVLFFFYVYYDMHQIVKWQTYRELLFAHPLLKFSSLFSIPLRNLLLLAILNIGDQLKTEKQKTKLNNCMHILYITGV